MSATEYVWNALRDDLIERWADTPSAVLEARILDVFERHPQLVIDAVDQISERFTRGIIHSPWPVFVTHIEKLATSAERSSRPAKGERDLASARARAEQWIRTVGLWVDREAELLDELFGDFGRLRAYRDDGALRESMLTLWQRERPRAVRAEQEAAERMRQQGEHYRRQHELERARRLPLDALPTRDEPDDEYDYELAEAEIANPFIEDA